MGRIIKERFEELPEGLSADTFAAFMPQMFSRIGRYMNEMQLGETNELMINTLHGPCQLFRRGKVFLAVVGQIGEILPVAVRLIADEIARQNP